MTDTIEKDSTITLGTYRAFIKGELSYSKMSKFLAWLPSENNEPPKFKNSTFIQDLFDNEFSNDPNVAHRVSIRKVNQWAIRTYIDAPLYPLMDLKDDLIELFELLEQPETTKCVSHTRLVKELFWLRELYARDYLTRDLLTQVGKRIKIWVTDNAWDGFEIDFKNNLFINNHSQSEVMKAINRIVVRDELLMELEFDYCEVENSNYEPQQLVMLRIDHIPERIFQQLRKSIDYVTQDSMFMVVEAPNYSILIYPLI